MLLRTIIRRQGLPGRLFKQSRFVSYTTPAQYAKPLGAVKPGAASVQKLANSTSASVKAAKNNNNVANNTINVRKKLNKAKAQASASRALREELASIVQKDDSSHSSEIDATVLQKAQKEDTIAQTITDQPNRRLNDAIAYATAESYDFQKLIASNRLPAGWQLLEDDEVIYIPHWPQSFASNVTTSVPQSSGSGEVFVFQSGSYVTWGLSSDQSSRFLRAVLQGRGGKTQSAEVESYKEIGDEAMECIVAEDQITRIVGDVIVIGQAPRIETDDQFDPDLTEESVGNNNEDTAEWSPLFARLAFSQGLSRSARLSVQEGALSTYLEEVASLPGQLEQEGKVPLHRKEVIRKMGTLLKLRQRANLDSENFLDDPEMYWENWKVEHHYDSICLALDMEIRFKAHNEKLDHGENLLGVLRALLTEQSTHRMELIIIYLIAVEVCLALFSHGYVTDLYNWVTGRGREMVEGEIEKIDLHDDEHVLSMLRRLLVRDSPEAVASSPHRFV